MPLKRPSVAAKEAETIEHGTQRLVVDIPSDLHREMKLRVVSEGRTIKAYVIEILREDMGRWAAQGKK
jgi:hypothetical protein